jgi:hypothetical protein
MNLAFGLVIRNSDTIKLESKVHGSVLHHGNWLSESTSTFSVLILLIMHVKMITSVT